MEDLLTQEDRILLLYIARETLENVIRGQPLPDLDLSNLPHKLTEPGVTFITLTIKGELRGCIGALEPYQPLVEDVHEHTIAAALHDFRFPPVSPAELNDIKIEVSRLTPPKDVVYQTPQELLEQLHPGIDGVILREGIHRATFLPQVWEKIPDKATFLNQLCRKMGSPHDIWLRRKLQVQTYQVEEFHE